MINAGCLRADCDVLIHDGAAGVNQLNIASARQHHALIKDNSPKSKIISILTRLINKCLHFKMFPSGLVLGGHECLCATSQKRHITRVILFTVNYC